jgi:hypothetical protein
MESPLKIVDPVPIIVVIIPVDTTRTRLFPVSAIYTFPPESTLTPYGELSVHAVAGPLSPENAGDPEPAKVVMMFWDILRILWFEVSAIYKSPEDVNQIPIGPLS